MESATAPTNPFRAAVEAGDFEAMVAQLGPDIVFHSPATFKPYVGRESVGGLLRAVFETFEDFRYTDELAVEGPDGPLHALIFRARVGDREVEGLDLIRVGEDGLIADFTVMVRPLSGLIALAEALGPKLAERGVTAAG